MQSAVSVPPRDHQGRGQVQGLGTSAPQRGQLGPPHIACRTVLGAGKRSSGSHRRGSVRCLVSFVVSVGGHRPAVRRIPAGACDPAAAGRVPVRNAAGAFHTLDRPRASAGMASGCQLVLLRYTDEPNDLDRVFGGGHPDRSRASTGSRPLTLHSLFAPASMPLTRARWLNRKMMRTGTTAISVARASSGR